MTSRLEQRGPLPQLRRALRDHLPDVAPPDRGRPQFGQAR
jgi:hypothetical protein